MTTPEELMALEWQHVVTISPRTMYLFREEFECEVWELKSLTDEQRRWLRDRRAEELKQRAALKSLAEKDRP